MGPMQALLRPGETLTYTDPTEAFSLYVKLAVDRRAPPRRRRWS